MYGHHQGLIQGALREIIQQTSCQFVEEEAFLSSPHLFLERTLFSPPVHTVSPLKILILQNVEEKKWALYGEILEALPANRALVLTHASAVAASPLVQHFLQNAHTGAVPCYEGSLGDSRVFLARGLQLKGLSLTPDALEKCVNWTRNGAWVEAVESLALYRGLNKTLPLILAEVAEILQPEEDGTTWPPFFSPDKTFFYTLLEAVHEENFIKNIRGWQRQVVQLGQLKHILTTETIAPELAAKRIRPPIFFKHIPLMLDQRHVWSLKALTKALQHLYACEILAKKGSPLVVLQSRLWQALRSSSAFAS